MLCAGFLPATLRSSSALLLFAGSLTAWAAEQHGRVAVNGVPLPGATVTATQGAKKLTATTDTQKETQAMLPRRLAVTPTGAPMAC